MAMRKIEKGKTAEVERKRVLVGIMKMILWTNKCEIGKWKLSKTEKQTFGGDYRGGCMHN